MLSVLKDDIVADFTHFLSKQFPTPVIFDPAAA